MKNTLSYYLILSLFFICGGNLHAVAQQDGVALNLKVLLQGAMMHLLPGDTLMRDDLRAKGYLPLVEPYSNLTHFEHVGNDGGGETVAGAPVFEVEGPDAIVDWVFIELRDQVALDSVIATRSALLQRDGDVVDVDGVSALFFPSVSAGAYDVAVRHRNHLGAMTEDALDLSFVPVFFDFTSPNYDIYGADIYVQIAMNGKRALWGGDLNHDGRILFQGPGNDVFPLFTQILYAASNNLLILNYVAAGYFESDVDLDGFTIYMGPGNDKQKFFTEIYGKILSICPTCPDGDNYIFIEALP
ncbi:MAG: hypothetical protein R2830_08960 [Saprospiraceae bacterium]